MDELHVIIRAYRLFSLLKLQSNPLNITSLYVILRFMSRNSLSPASSHWI